LVNHLTILAEQRSALVKECASQLGFDFCGISKAEFLENEATRLENWLNEGKHGSMSYIERNFDKRLDPRLLVPGAKSVVSLLYNYYPEERLDESDEALKISKYAYGEDYHLVIKDKLYELVSILKDKIGEVNGRVFVDSAPVMEKAWAAKSGLGWVGKNANLITKTNGSFYFIAELVIDVELEADGPIKDYCGTCTRCIDACPTDAIPAPYVIDGSRCISYLTIEIKEAIPEEFVGKTNNWVFGCDICQDVCPWNRFSKPHHEQKFLFSPELKDLQHADWQELNDVTFKRVFGKSALQRPGYEKFKMGVRIIP
jgi:epoxyqueuosine reductase